MEQLLNFIVENYIWILIIGIVILMTIIGYIADKTDFGKEKMKKEKTKKEKIEEPTSIENSVDEMEWQEEPIEESPVIPAFETDEMSDLEEPAMTVDN